MESVPQVSEPNAMPVPVEYVHYDDDDDFSGSEEYEMSQIEKNLENIAMEVMGVGMEALEDEYVTKEELLAILGKVSDTALNRHFTDDFWKPWVDTLFELTDENKDGKVGMDELGMAMMKIGEGGMPAIIEAIQKFRMTEAQTNELFDWYESDNDSDNFISKSDIVNFLQEMNDSPNSILYNVLGENERALIAKWIFGLTKYTYGTDKGSQGQFHVCVNAPLDCLGPVAAQLDQFHEEDFDSQMAYLGVNVPLCAIMKCSNYAAIERCEAAGIPTRSAKAPEVVTTTKTVKSTDDTVDTAMTETDEAPEVVTTTETLKSTDDTVDTAITETDEAPGVVTTTKTLKSTDDTVDTAEKVDEATTEEIVVGAEAEEVNETTAAESVSESGTYKEEVYSIVAGFALILFAFVF